MPLGKHQLIAFDKTDGFHFSFAEMVLRHFGFHFHFEPAFRQETENEQHSIEYNI
jgi:hypothetical protein